MTIFTPEEVQKGMDRLGAHPDAKFLRQHLMRIVTQTSSPGLADGALRHGEGRRSLAAELIAKLDLSRGADGGGTDDGSGYIGGGAQPVANARSGAPRRVPALGEPGAPVEQR